MRKTEVPLYVVEAFTTGNNEAFTGNTAAVCVLDVDDDIRDKTKQKMGMNMNLSETAFVSKGWERGTRFSDPLRWTIRWFTPTIEVELCGHATLASANIVFNEILKDKYSSEAETTIVFESKFRGELGATMHWSTGLITLNFPTSETVPVSVQVLPWLTNIIEKTLGPDLQPDIVEDIHYTSKAISVILIRLRDTNQGHAANEALLKKLTPNFQGLLDVEGQDALEHHAVMVTIKGSKDEGSPNFFSRFFAPWAGIGEDPVTGSAHSVLVPFWMKEFQKEGVHLRTLVGVQSSKRGGKLTCNIDGDRVHIAGSTNMALKGNFIF